ncbi:unnamed protein product [Linum tenue]|uniref:Protein kinase domain-containing protein n=1 Tax=Linum tenue TaxID=586396 RepID=A0AAV0QIE0_9ROSI|nr:unnamed protein product [Linum tenue]
MTLHSRSAGQDEAVKATSRRPEIPSDSIHSGVISEAYHGAAAENVTHDSCRTTASCGSGSAAGDVRFPFTIRGMLSSGYEGFPGFELSCSTETNQTLLYLPNSANFTVQSIDYKSQLIYLGSPDGCLPRQLRHLNLSTTPFVIPRLGYTSFSFLNCSKAIIGSSPISCLGPTVYAYSSRASLYDVDLVSCKKMYALPWSNDDEYGNVFLLSWSSPRCSRCYRAKGECCLLKKKQGSNNPEVECSGDAHREKVSSLKKALIPGVTLGAISIAALLIALYRAYRFDRQEKEYRLKMEEFLDDYKALKPTRFSYADIKRITNQFNDELGRGAHGTVFKGKLSSEIQVAVKVLDNNVITTKGNEQDFVNEVGAMAGIHHVNVLRLVGFCADGFRRALVYEYLPNDSLQKYISSQGNEQHSSLGWKKLQEIAIGIAKGIEYLHQGCHQRILHFDIKPHNILLDQDFNPKISDFGLAKLCAKDQSAISMTAARGTIGYIAPEVFSRNFGSVSYKADVYSFGMLLLEMVGGRKNVDVTSADGVNQIYFPEWIYSLFSESGEDVRFDVEEVEEEEKEYGKIRKKLATVGLWCIQWNPVDRPPMKLVVQMLEGEGDNLTPPPNPVSSNIGGVARMGKPRPLQELEIIPETE